MNEYSSQWFSTFLDPMPEEWTSAEVAGVTRFLPRADFSRVLDICCGPGRHAVPLIEQGYLVTGIDRDDEALATARRRAPTATFLELDQRDLAGVPGTFDAALILWQSFGYFDPASNDAVLAAIADRLRPGGRLLLDLYHPGFVRAHAGTTTVPLAPDCRSITDEVVRDRLRSTISYGDGSTETMDFELLEPEDLAARAARVGFTSVAACTWWDPARPPTPDEHRYQLVLGLADP